MSRRICAFAALLCVLVTAAQGCGMPWKNAETTETYEAPVQGADEEETPAFDDADAALPAEKEETITVHADAAGVPFRP